MIIVNITPDSFSDGGLYQNYHSFAAHLKNCFLDKNSIIDIGAESTAPTSDPTSYQEEIKRFEETLIPFLKETSWPPSIKLSLDTYKIETIDYLGQKIFSIDSQIKLIWNDVSGLNDQETIKFLKNNPKIEYIYSHNLVPCRELSSHHMQYCDNSSKEDERYISCIIEYFQTAFQFFSSYGMMERVIFDPLLGFAKTRKQNIIILRELARIISSFSHEHVRWLLGISRKSFLRPLGSKITPDVIEVSEWSHVYMLAQWMQELKDYSLIFRVHNHKIFDEAQYLAVNFPFKSNVI